ncbi:hypothetical protein GF361_00340 [Candidatus Woesearchaeota archaeon]|nr:hypothetical protein [Candidatus Woesearchaeota archaeon]
MILDIPFYKNDKDGNQCMQVAMKIVLKHFLDKDYSLEELDKLTKRKKEKWTWTSQVVSVLYDLGLDVRYYSSVDLKDMLEGEGYVRKTMGKEADRILKFMDVPVVLDSIKKLLEYDIFEKKKLKFKEIEDLIEKGAVPMMLIDYSKLSGKKGYNGHFVVVTGFDSSNTYYHESGPKDPEANKKINKKKFIDAWNSKGTDNDVVIVFSKR